MTGDLLLARAEFLAAARSSVAYCKAASIDWAATRPATGGLFLADVEPEPMQRFRFAPGGIEAAVIEAIGEHSDTVLDLVAWPVADPGNVMTALGRVAVLGMAAADNPTTFAFGQPLRLFRTPRAWLQAGCNGAVPLDLRRAAGWLRDVDGAVAAEDHRHAAEIRHAVIGSLRLERILVPKRRRSAA